MYPLQRPETGPNAAPKPNPKKPGKLKEEATPQEPENAQS